MFKRVREAILGMASEVVCRDSFGGVPGGSGNCGRGGASNDGASN